MPHFGPAIIGLVTVATILVLGICAVGIGITLAEIFALRRERQQIRRCILAAREEAEQTHKK